VTLEDQAAAHADFAGIQALSSRSAGYAVARKCLEVQAEAEAMDPSLRRDGGVRLHPDARPWYTGALGEIEVGRILAGLGPQWFVRHSVPIGAGTKDVDHLVIGPGGVFAINTKHHRGASIWVGDHVLRINNANTKYLNAATRDGLDVAGRLQRKVGFAVPVISVVAVLGAHSITDRRAPEQQPVKVVDARRLVDWLNAQPILLDEGALGIIRLAAEEPETWHVDPTAANTLRVMQRFDRLREQVEQTTPSRPPARVGGSGRRMPASPPRRPAARARTRPPTIVDLLKLWFATAVIVVALFAIRGWADQPCTSALACVMPHFYLTLRPLLMLFGGVVILGCCIGTATVAVHLRRR
jgi:hypothetical protein